METTLEKYKGIHPGLILERELQKRKIKKGPFALRLQEYPQILNDITKGRRGFTTALSLKVDAALGFEEGTMLILQAYHDIDKEKKRSNLVRHPDLLILRENLFWDTDINKIDWERQYKAVIARVFERGNEEEKNEITRFYGQDKVKSIVGNSGDGLKVMPHLKIK
jgi:plasmid maintenance system antidote protein VapI